MKRFHLWLVSALALGSYWATLLPGVGFSGDTAEFQFIGRVFGVPHATGYPTYVMLNGLFVRIVPFGSLAFRANLLSSVLAAVAVALVFRISRDRVRQPAIAAAAALLLGWSPVFWSQAVVAEVYALNAVFVGLTLHLFLTWRRTRSTHHFLTACGFYALSFGNHLTMITFLPAIAFLGAVTNPGLLKNGRIMAAVGLCVALGMAQYFFLMWRSWDPQTAYVWRGAGTLDALWTLVSGAQFTRAMFAFTLEQVLEQRIPLFLTVFWRQFAWAVPLILVGLIRSCRRRDGWFLLLAFAGNVFYALNYWIGDIEVYFIPCFMIAAVWFADGADVVVARIGGSQGLRRVLAGAIWLFPAALLLCHGPEVDRSGDTADAVETERILAEVGSEGLLVSDSWMRSTSLWYYLLGERCCSDSVQVFHQFDADALAGYVRGGQPLWLSETRHELLTRLSVYAPGEQWLTQLQSQGLYLFAVADRLYAVRAESTLGPELAHKHDVSPTLAPVDRAVEYLDGWKGPEKFGRWAIQPRATVIFSSYHPPAELVIQATPWQQMGGFRTIRVLVNDSPVADFRLAGANWQMQEFTVPLPDVLHNAVVTLEIRDAQGELVPESETYSLPVGSIQLRRHN